MISINDFQSQFLDYAARSRLWNELQQREQADDLNELLLLVIESEELLLRKFGLPCTLSYSKLLQEYSLKSALKLDDVSALYSALASLADEYLLSPVLSDIDLLIEAQKKKIYIDEVFPQLSLEIKAEPYYLYLYCEFLLKGRLSAVDFMNEVLLVKKHDLSQRLQRLTEGDNMAMAAAEDTEICSCGLNYLNHFLQGYKEFENKFYREPYYHD